MFVSKLTLDDERVAINGAEISKLVSRIFVDHGCTLAHADQISEHLVEANLCGVESHGVMRVLQYVDQMKSGYLKATGDISVAPSGPQLLLVDGGGMLGIPAMEIAQKAACELALEQTMAVAAIGNVGHTGRLGAFTETAASKGCLMIIIGGGNRETWRQVAPFGGAKPMLGTNPYCLAIPGGERGPVVLDFATSKMAGGWVYAARSAGAQLPEGCLVDRNGNPSTDPEDYFSGGAIQPAAGAKGYGMALMAELICEAMLGPVKCECNWLMIAINTSRFRDSSQIAREAEAILAELRACPPAPGFDKVEIPGERERQLKQASNGVIHLPKRTLAAITALANA